MTNLDPSKRARAEVARIVDAARSELPKERWSCSDDESGTALTLARQRRWSADAVRAALAKVPLAPGMRITAEQNEALHSALIASQVSPVAVGGEELRARIDAGLKSFCSAEPDFGMSSTMRRNAADHILAQPYIEAALTPMTPLVLDREAVARQDLLNERMKG